MIHSSSKTNPQSWYFDRLNKDSRTEGDHVFLAPAIENIQNKNRTKIIAKLDEIIGHLHEHLLSVKSTTGYDESKIEHNHVKCKAQGYSHAMNDWKDVEMTAYIKFLVTDPESCFYMYARSGKHVEGKPCEGTKYAMCLNPDGTINAEKELWHPGGYSYFPKVSILGDIEGQRVGMKFILYNKPDDNNSVMLECYIDINADNKWRKVYSVIDSGEGEEGFTKCGDETTKTITWGGPIIGFRGRHIPDGGIEIDNMSVREIVINNSKLDRADRMHRVLPSVVHSDSLRPSLPDNWDDDPIEVDEITTEGDDE